MNREALIARRAQLVTEIGHLEGRLAEIDTWLAIDSADRVTVERVEEIGYVSAAVTKARNPRKLRKD